MGQNPGQSCDNSPPVAPHPTDCSRYLICVGGTYIVAGPCPPGTVFDSDDLVCDYPHNISINSPCISTASTSMSMVNPPNSYKEWVFGAGQKVYVTVKNNNFMLVLYTMHDVFDNLVSGTSLYPYGEDIFEDDIFGVVPVTYRYKINIGSGAALMHFSAKWRI